MTPRTNSTLQSLDSTHEHLATRRIDTSDTFFGFSVMESLRAWSAVSGGSTMLTVYRVAHGFVVGALRFGESSRHAQYSLYKVTSDTELFQLVQGLSSRGELVAICAAPELRSVLMERAATSDSVSTRTEGQLARFRRDALGREDFFEGEFRHAMLEDACQLGGLCSEQAVEIVYADLVTLMLSGPDVSVRH